MSHLGAGYMAELEAADWKDNRRFRILALHYGQLSFADYAFHTGAVSGSIALTTHSQAGSSFAIEPQDSSAYVGAPTPGSSAACHPHGCSAHRQQPAESSQGVSDYHVGVQLCGSCTCSCFDAASPMQSP